ncbi:hypothetical protein K3495_g17397, partial [Podosphaera aphanis]
MADYLSRPSAFITLESVFDTTEVENQQSESCNPTADSTNGQEDAILQDNDAVPVPNDRVAEEVNAGEPQDSLEPTIERLDHLNRTDLQTIFEHIAFGHKLST